MVLVLVVAKGGKTMCPGREGNGRFTGLYCSSMLLSMLAGSVRDPNTIRVTYAPLSRLHRPLVYSEGLMKVRVMFLSIRHFSSRLDLRDMLWSLCLLLVPSLSLTRHLDPASIRSLPKIETCREHELTSIRVLIGFQAIRLIARISSPRLHPEY